MIALREGDNEVVTRAHEGTLGSTTLGQRRQLLRETARATQSPTIEQSICRTSPRWRKANTPKQGRFGRDTA